MGRGHAGSVSFPWGNAIWNSSESQRGPPNRLIEVLPSPTSIVPPGSAGLRSEDPMLSPPLNREITGDSSIPFAIPLQPTLKTYRSQSYSVGQMDPDSAQTPAGVGGLFSNGRARSGIQYGGLQHRPSRPSMLGDMSHDPTLLGQLREVEDDDESSNGSEAGVHLSTTQARAIEQLAMENALLRQAAAEQLDNNRGRNRAVTTNSATQAARSTTQAYNQRIHEAVPEEISSPFYDPDELEGSQLYHPSDLNGRRASEYAMKAGRQFSVTGIPENRTLESVKKGHWQSSLGFGGLGEPPQSRRHSFADVPTRQTSLSSASESQKSFAAAGSGHRNGGKHGSPSAYGEGLVRPSQSDSVSYFSGMDSSLRTGDVNGPITSPTTFNPAYQAHHQHGRSQHPSQQPRPHQLLYIVTFKACRADVFYVQEGTGLQVKPGDLVIVEADRGTDLGTVAHDNVPWSKAKEMKEHYMEEHYRWLMIFSRHGQEGTTAGANPNGQKVSHVARAGTIGGTGVISATQDAPSSDVKPKMIKRLAQAHEIQTLRDKEGNEAKAKRVCQQKVVEHRLNMEILDAEFQMDWKKLTFYYFADSYINFNPLVTDLFKIYKTRIWMSAINPASFATPVAGLQLPSGLGPGAFNTEADPYSARHQKTEIGNPVFGAPNLAQGTFDRIWDSNQNTGINSVPFAHVYSQPFQHQDVESRQIDQVPIDYRPGVPQATGSQPQYASVPYHVHDVRSPNYTVRPHAGSGEARKPHVLATDWGHAFQGLSLGS